VYMDSLMSPSVNGVKPPVASKWRLHLAGSVLHLVGGAQEASALKVASLVPPDADVLNIGRTNRQFVRQLKARQPASRVVQLSRRELEALPYRADTFDAVTCLFSLHYWRNIPDAFPEMARTLKPGGILAFSELSAEDAAAHREGTSRVVRFITESPPIADYYRRLDSAGLRVHEALPTFYSRHGLLVIARKDSE
jgi:ubiquinone/menaquinone biosynthesis C-methylase UbiE